MTVAAIAVIPWRPQLLVAASAALLVFLASVLMIARVSADARKTAADWKQEVKKQEVKPASTIIEFTDGRKKDAPGALVVCSEHFCGFHDGETATVISLEGVRSIQSPVPQSTNQQPTAQPDDAGRTPAGGGAVGSGK